MMEAQRPEVQPTAVVAEQSVDARAEHLEALGKDVDEPRCHDRVEGAAAERRPIRVANHEHEAAPCRPRCRECSQQGYVTAWRDRELVQLDLPAARDRV